MIVGTGETAEVGAVTDPGAGHEERGAGRLRLRRLRGKQNQTSGGADPETRTRNDRSGNCHRSLPDVLFRLTRSRQRLV
jgi:hypothetical protein